MEYNLKYTSCEPYRTFVSPSSIIDLEKRMVTLEKQIQQLKHRIAELELRGV